MHKKEESGRLTNAIVQFTKAQGLDPAFLWDGLGVDERILTDVNAWVASDVFNTLMARLRERTGDPRIMERVGFSITDLRSFGFINLLPYFLKDPLQFVNQLLDGTLDTMTRTSEMDILELTPKEIVLTHRVKPGHAVLKDTCYLIRGSFAGLPKAWGMPPAKVDEEACQVDGAHACRFRIIWPKLAWWHWIAIWWNRHRMRDELFRLMYQQNTLIEQKYEEALEKTAALEQAYFTIMESLMEALDAKDPYTRSHSRSVAAYAVEIAKADGRPAAEIEEIRKAALLHDIGKIGIPDHILLKSGSLNDNEWASIRTHPVLGAKILQPLSFLGPIITMVSQEHERFDGRGYPKGLTGDQIHRGAQIISVADALDAMTSGRAYRKNLSFDEAAAEIRRSASTQFDPTVIVAFTAARPRLTAIHHDAHHGSRSERTGI